MADGASREQGGEDGVRIEPAGAFCLDLLAALHGGCFSDGWGRDAFARLLAMPGAFADLLVEGDAPVGFALYSLAADEGELLSIGVLPQRQGRGYAKKLLRAGMARAAGAGATSLFLEVAEDNPAARALYLSLGFSRIGRRKKYYRRPEGAVDALVMMSNLS